MRAEGLEGEEGMRENVMVRDARGVSVRDSVCRIRLGSSLFRIKRTISMSSMVLLSWTYTEIWSLVLGYNELWGLCLGYELLVRRRIWRLGVDIYTGERTTGASRAAISLQSLHFR